MEHDVEILLVEDNPNDAELALDALREAMLANHIHVVSDGAEALDFIFRQGDLRHPFQPVQPKLILLDLKLPKVNGLEVLARIRADAGQHGCCQCVVLTSSHEERDIVESYRLNVNSTIVKPVDFEQFSTQYARSGIYWLLQNQPPTL